MAQKSIGLSLLRLGAVGATGGMGATLTALGATVADTAVITTEEGSTTDFNIEESDSPFYSFLSTPGKVVFNWSTYDVDTSTLQRFFGGAAPAGTPAVWEMPDTIPTLEQSIEITTKDLWKIEIVRASVLARLQWAFQKTKLAQIDFTATVLQPTLTGTKKIKVTEP